MRARPVLLGVLATLSSTSHALPFRTRGAHSDTNGDTAAEVDASGIHILFPESNAQNRRNAVVEGFFADSQSYSTPLRDEIRAQAGNLADFLTTTRRTLHRHPE